MCGIYGYYGFSNVDNKKIISLLKKRGPDDHKKFSRNKITIGATRLAIRDRINGSQPFFHKELKIYASLNGEIYNYVYLKNLIKKKGYKFKTNCDTELIGPGYYYFKNKFFSMINGMFAISIYDLNKKCFVLVRDRFGIKPLYFHKNGKKFIYSSSAKSIYEQPYFKKKINEHSLISVLKKRYVESDNHIFQNLHQVKKGQVLKFFLNGKLREEKYLKYNISNRKKTNLYKETEDFFVKNISTYNISDVDIGILLSSGVDSNLLSSYLSKKKTKNYCVNFLKSKFSEKSNVLKYHDKKKIKFVNFGNNNFIKTIVPAVNTFDSPICDGVIFPMYELFKKIKQDKTKVIISGEGADEIFGGYYYLKIAKLVCLINKLKLNFISRKFLKYTDYRILNVFFNYQGELGNLGKKRMIDFLRKKNPSVYDFEELISVFDHKELKKLLIFSIPNNLKKNRQILDIKNLNSSTGLNWLSKYNCFKLDQISMNFGVEARVPYLDNFFYKIFILFSKNGFVDASKKILRELLFKKSNLRIKRKLAFQNYMNKEKKNKIIKYIKNRILPTHKVFSYIKKSEFEKIINNYKLSNEILLEKKIFSILILTLWIEENA